MNPACEKLARDYGYLGKIKLLANATDLPVLENKDETRKLMREKLGIEEQEFVLISVGRLSKQKNLKFVIDVAAELKRKNVQYKLLIVGSGPCEKHFNKRVKKLKIEDKVSFLGKVTKNNEKIAIYATADLHIFPSFYDTDGIVRIEAAAAGVATISIEGSISSSSIANGVNGYIGANDVGQYANLIVEIMNNPKKHQKICKNATEQLYHSWSEVIESLKNIYYSPTPEQTVCTK